MREEKKTRQVSVSRRVRVFNDTYNLIEHHRKKKIFESEGFNPLKNYGPDNPFEEGTTFFGLDDSPSSTDDDESKKKTDTPPFDTTDAIKYITQVRNSFGFDVDVVLPTWLSNMCALFLYPVDLSQPERLGLVNATAKLAIDEINVDMESKSKTYELVKVAKVVTSHYPYLLSYLTLTVKNVEEAEAAAAATTTTIQAIVKRHMNIPWELVQWRIKPRLDSSIFRS